MVYVVASAMHRHIIVVARCHDVLRWQSHGYAMSCHDNAMGRHGAP